MKDYELIVIGAGPGGYVAAIRAAQLGMKTAVIEKQDVGGTCLNRGCVPTKALLHSAELVNEIKEADVFGVNVEGVALDFKKMHERKQEVVDKLRSGVEQLFKANGIDLIRGHASIAGEGSIRVMAEDGERALSCDRILIASGSKPSAPPIPGLDLPGVVTSDEILMESSHPYKSLVIIGGGVIGMEFATFYNAIGCQVTVIEAMDRIIPTMDKEIAQNLGMILKKKGVKIMAGCRVENVEKNENEGTQLRVNFITKGKNESAEAEAVLVAIGRRPNTEGLFQEGFQLDMERGRIIIDKKFETSVKNVYAIGDVSSKIQLAHVASAQGAAAVEMMAGKAMNRDLNAVPGCIYTSPEIATVGITADEAREAGRAVKTGKFVMFSNARTMIKDGDRGFIKLVSDEETGEVLGAQLMCERATDMISELTTAVANKLTAEQMLKVMRPHPTFNEAISEAFEDMEGGSIHTAPKRR
jgi:dihydrolipoamide dehydrogenase